jgi:copper transport protein
MMDDALMVMATLTPGRAGPVAIDLAISDFDGEPREAQAVTVASAAPGLGIGPIRRAAERTADGWRVGDLVLPAAGPWVIGVELRLGRFELRKFEAEIELP